LTGSLGFSFRRCWRACLIDGFLSSLYYSVACTIFLFYCFRHQFRCLDRTRPFLRAEYTISSIYGVDIVVRSSVAFDSTAPVHAVLSPVLPVSLTSQCTQYIAIPWNIPVILYLTSHNGIQRTPIRASCCACSIMEFQESFCMKEQKAVEFAHDKRWRPRRT
jgi:hypothetical protein